MFISSSRNKKIILVLVISVLFLAVIVFLASNSLKEPKNLKSDKKASEKIEKTKEVIGIDKNGIILPDKVCENILNKDEKQRCLDKWIMARAARQTKNIKECALIKNLSKRWECMLQIAGSAMEVKFCERIADHTQREICFQDVGIALRNEEYCEIFNGEPHEKQECVDRIKAFKYGDAREVNRCDEIETLEYSMLCVNYSLGLGANIPDCDQINNKHLRDRCISLLLFSAPLTKDKCEAMPIEDFEKVCLLEIENEGKKNDTDGDGIPDGLEIWIQTEPFNPDTDDDGLTDGEEFFDYHTNMVESDTDDDGLTDYDEIKIYKTHPNRPDSDGDGISDGEEVRRGANPNTGDADKDRLLDVDEVKFGTDINNLDTDGDGMSDFKETRSGFDPLKPGKILADTDGDGLLDIDEMLYQTDKFNPDTDDDGINDKDEIDNLTNPLGDGNMDFDGDGISDKDEEKYGTNSGLSDADRDGLNDYEEIFIHKTDSNKRDTDGDGYSDGEEVRKGYNPLVKD